MGIKEDVAIVLKNPEHKDYKIRDYRILLMRVLE